MGLENSQKIDVDDVRRAAMKSNRAPGKESIYNTSLMETIEVLENQTDLLQCGTTTFERLLGKNS